MKDRTQGTKSTPYAGQFNPDSAIRKIIQIAASLDRKLAESYIKAYTDEENFNNEDPETSREKATQIAAAYLKVATQLVEKDPNLALLTAEKSLNIGVIPDTLVFLTALRKQHPPLANRFFLGALRGCQARKAKDVNELLLLYAFVFSPHRVPVVTPRGIGAYSIPDYLPAIQGHHVDPLLARQYLEVSSGILLDAGRYLPEELHRLPAGVVGDFYLLSLLESIAAEYLPNVSQSLSAQRNVLVNFLQSEERTAATTSVERWNNIPSDVNLAGSGNNATVDYLVSRAEQSSNPKVRNQFFFRAALAAVHDKQDERAEHLTSKLSSEYGDQARQMLTLAIAERNVRNGQLDEAEQLARSDKVPVRRCYIFTLIADSLVRGRTKDFPRATQLLSEVEQLAHQLTSKEERMSVLEGAAAVYLWVAPGRSFELLRETITTANKLDGFTGYLSVDQTLDVGGFFFDFSIYDEEFGYFDLLNRLGARDYYQTIQSVREIQNRSLRIHSIVVVCKAALSTTRTAGALKLPVHRQATQVADARPLDHRHPVMSLSPDRHWQ
ncbi:MAG TPA: hypothetical protein VNO50_09105 [Pyrinomonadaceae bacterium]|nr:hypothetical protein [Pyrinomonadaceae bacterium]